MPIQPTDLIDSVSESVSKAISGRVLPKPGVAQIPAGMQTPYKSVLGLSLMDIYLAAIDSHSGTQTMPVICVCRIAKLRSQNERTRYLKEERQRLKNKQLVFHWRVSISKMVSPRFAPLVQRKDALIARAYKQP